LPQFAGDTCEKVFARLARPARRSPRPVTLPGRPAVMRAVQQQVPPPLRGAAGDDDRRPVRTLTADRLTIPCGERLSTSEISHVPIATASPEPSKLSATLWIHPLAPSQDRADESTATSRINDYLLGGREDSASRGRCQEGRCLGP